MSEQYPQPVDPRRGPAPSGPGSAARRPQPVDGRADSASAAPAAPPAASGADLARQALARARAEARERGAVPRGTGPRRRGRLRSRNEPQMFGEAVRTWLIEHGWQEQVAIGGVFGRWSEIVGEFNARRLRPESYSEGELVLVADSPTMAAHARSMVRDLMRRVNEELGEGTVVSIRIKGPGSRRR
ncbi:hypothetical protein SUDANB121_03183 [Nocardiopsis dassonvillei]